MNRTRVRVAAGAALAAALTLGACTPADNASRNVSEAAENFKVDRQLTVINGITDKVMFQLNGRFSIETPTADSTQPQLEVTAKLPDGSFRKHFVGLSDNTTYVVEDLSQTQNADAWLYRVFYLPGTPVTVELETP